MKALLAVLLISTAGAQQPSPLPSFDAASVKQNHSASNAIGGTIGIGKGGTVSSRNITVRTLIDIAYDVMDYQLTGGPAWMSSTGYDVEAKPEQPVDRPTAHLMLQNLLIERFHLLTHREIGTVNGFHLAVDKGGSKLKASEATDIGFRNMGPGRIHGVAEMPMLASILVGFLHVPIEDRTGMAGKYDIDLKWTPDEAANGEPSVSLFAAIRDQLGLSLDAVKVPMEKVVIDRLERPTGN